MSSSNGEREFKINIAIDGPAGAGKSTVARKVAKELSYVYVDTGAMYRAVTWDMLNRGIDAEDETAVLERMGAIDIELVPGDEGQRVWLSGTDVTDEIRSLAVNRTVSRYAQIEGLRAELSAAQRQMALRKGVVMDGRDIGTTVLPDAEVKIFMTATVEERARRRFRELPESDEAITLEQLESEIAQRDELDRNREVSPLVCAADATVLDTTNMTIDEVAEAIVRQADLKLSRTGQ
ncbi:(d)CMP kinase [Saccharibacillus alkalitolerans]|uniref:Cytidylate kinase n=1 Tax=Saccharibacillus alkalitolerans TaxID=2705290 RepID=A0ABX0F190_9BACL|nr:(d)CMP kinase [Saccharibacillus alkalitolerans]NGZ74230.1 (d)CMP kinase [Saccharibacillus alkalitolerans]